MGLPSALLGLRGDALEPDQITRHLEVLPHLAWRRGEVLPFPRGRISGRGHWRLRSRKLTTSEDPAEAVRALINLLGSSTMDLRTLPGVESATVSLAAEGQEQPTAARFPSELLGDLAARGLEFWIDVYCYPLSSAYDPLASVPFPEITAKSRPVHEYGAVLSLYGKSLDPTKLVAALGCPPSRAWKKGEVIALADGSSLIASMGGWQRSGTVVPQTDEGPEPIVDEILKLIPADLDLRSIPGVEKAVVTASAILTGERQGAAWFKPEVLGRLGRHGLQLDVDVYYPPRDGDSDSPCEADEQD
jgi:hypothetical protein